MTTRTITRERKGRTLLSLMLIFIFAAISIFLSKPISNYAKKGFELAFNVIIPTAFPFMILSDLALSVIDLSKSKTISNAFEKTFGINRIGINAYISGILGGFPIGAKNSVKLYENGKITKQQCERLLCISNMPSIPYVVCAVGIGMLGSIRFGIYLYLITVSSSFLTGFILKQKREIIQSSDINTRQNFNFVESVKSSAIGCLNVAFFISFFSTLCGIINSYLSNAYVLSLAFSVLEVGNACSYISVLYTIPFFARFIFLAFTLSFSGISVIMQSLSFSFENSISFINCILIKLLQGSLSVLISTILLLLI